MYDRDVVVAATDLTALADELLGPRRGTNRSGTWPCPNPGHTQTGRTPPVTVFATRRGEQRWKCHGCGEGGSAIDLVMWVRSVEFRDAIDALARRAGIPDQPVTSRGPTGRWRPGPPGPGPPGPSSPAIPPPVSLPSSLDSYVADCARALWTPAGSAVRRWLTRRPTPAELAHASDPPRGLPEAVLRTNRVGADLGARRQPRPPGVAKVHRPAAVLPARAGRNAIYVQLRTPQPPPDRPRYLNPTSSTIPNPRVGLFRPHERRHDEIIVTEGVIDALSANAAGYRAAAVLSATLPDPAVAVVLAGLNGRLVVAFDPDDAGRRGANRMLDLLDAHRRPAATLPLDADLNATLIRSQDWPTELAARVQAATPATPPATIAPGVQL